MSETENSPLLPLFRRLEQWGHLDNDDRNALLSLPHEQRLVEANRYIWRDGDLVTHVYLVRTGFAQRHRIVCDGGRQILAIQMAGDTDFNCFGQKVQDYGMQAISPCTIAQIPVEWIEQIASERPHVAMAMWQESLADHARSRAWMVNLGRRGSAARLCHLLCELAIRIDDNLMGTRGHYTVPLTQEQLADCLGLTAVHVNRTLRGLEKEGLITRYKRDITIRDWDALTAAGDFNAGYLKIGNSSRSSVVLSRSSSPSTVPRGDFRETPAAGKG